MTAEISGEREGVAEGMPLTHRAVVVVSFDFGFFVVVVAVADVIVVVMTVTIVSSRLKLGT